MSDEEKQPTPEEIAKLIEMAEGLVKKSLYSLLIAYLPELATTLTIPEESGCVRIFIKGFKETLCVGLSVVPRDFRAEIAVPNAECATDLYEHYEKVRMLTKVFWKHWSCVNPTIVELLKLRHPGVDFDMIQVDPIHYTSMYFAEDFPKRIGLIPCYADKNNKPLFRKR
jgi:hypothetical protein